MGGEQCVLKMLFGKRVSFKAAAASLYVSFGFDSNTVYE